MKEYVLVFKGKLGQKIKFKTICDSKEIARPKEIAKLRGKMMEVWLEDWELWEVARPHSR